MEDNNLWKKVSNWLTGMSQELGGSIVGDLISDGFQKFVGLRPAHNSSITRMFNKLVSEGKVSEANELLKADPEGKGWADENILLNDFLSLNDLAFLSEDEVIDFIRYLSKLKPYVKKNLRLTLTKETRDEYRRASLYMLAKISDDKVKNQLLKAIQIDHKPMSLVIYDGFKQWDRSRTTVVNDLTIRNAELRDRSSRSIGETTFGWIGFRTLAVLVFGGVIFVFTAILVVLIAILFVR